MGDEDDEPQDGADKPSAEPASEEGDGAAA